MKLNRRKKGFTLIELLVVISIIAMLLAILMPGLRKAKEVARNVVCRTNIRSLTLGFKTHVDSNDQKLFAKNNTLWMKQMEDQLGEIEKIRYCPETKLNTNQPPYGWNPDNGARLFGDAKHTWIWPFGVKDASGNPVQTENVTYEQAEHGSYAYNFYLYGSGIIQRPGHWMTPNPPNSSNVPIFADCKGFDFIPLFEKFPQEFDLNEGGGNANILGYITNRHRDQTNVGFIDGHVESVKLEKLWSLKWGKDFETQSIMTRPDGSPIYQKN